MGQFRLAVRRLTTRPVATLASVLTLACAIGAATAAWSLTSAVLLHPLPVREADRLMIVGEREATGPAAGMVLGRVLYTLYPAVRASGAFDEVSACWGNPLQLPVETGGLTVRTPVGFADHDLFSLLGVRVPLGRAILPEEDRRGAAPVALLTERYWRAALEADPDAVGRTITVAGKPATIIGVLARGFRGLDLAQPADLFLPLQTIGDFGSTTNFFADPSHPSSPTWGLVVVGRLGSNTSREQAVDRLPGVRVPGRRTTPLVLTPIETAAIPAIARAGMRQFTRLLDTTVSLLLLIGCAAVGILLLIRTEARREEFAMCLALGASRGRLACGVGLEGLVLALIGGVCGAPIAVWLIAEVRTFQLPGGVDIDHLNLSLDWHVALPATLAAVAATLLIAVIAGALGLTANVGDALRSRAGTTPRAQRRRTRAVLVTIQVAVSLVLLAGAGLFGRSLLAALQLNSGVQAERLVTADVSLDPFGRGTSRDQAFFDELLRRVRRDPTIASASYSVSRGGMLGKLVVDGVARQFPTQVHFDAVDAAYFDTMRLPIVEGRNFSPDHRVGSPPVAVVSQSFAELIGNGRSAVGSRITMPYHEMGKPADVMTVVGVVPDVIIDVDVLEPLSMYFPLAQITPRSSRLVSVRAAGTAAAAKRALASAIRRTDPAVEPQHLMTIEERIAQQMSAQQFALVVLGTLGMVAVLLTALGTFVLAESMVALRRREMGIRAALGATGVQLGTLVLRETTRLVVIGLAAGLTLAWLGADAIRAFLFEVGPLDLATLGTVAAMILTIALLVSVRPAVRIARIDVARVLKEE